MNRKKEKKAIRHLNKIVNDITNSKNNSSRRQKKKYRQAIDDDKLFPDVCDMSPRESPDHNLEQMLKSDLVLTQLLLDTYSDSGFFMGYKKNFGFNKFFGIRQGTEGNILIIGGNGSGKSAGIIKPTLYTWKAALCVTDIKGELSSYYQKLYQCGYVKRPFIIFDPMQPDGAVYDPFDLVTQDGEMNIICNIREIVLAIIPTPPGNIDPFWAESEQNVLTAALLYYYHLGCSFIESMTKIASSTVAKLSKEISEENDTQAKIFLGQILDLKPEQIACIDRGIRNKLSVFATDPYIQNAFRSAQSNTDCFTWDDLTENNIFLCIPAGKIEEWSGAINVMYTQLIRHLERRPDQYSPEGVDNTQTLLLMDEFARFGKLEMITNALATLRSKNINICLAVQSLAQIDKFYGTCDRRIILDNCQFQAVLRANDADTQENISHLIGTHLVTYRGKSESFDDLMDPVGYSNQLTETREYIVFPHELSILTDIPLITPYGFCRVDKLQLNNNLAENPLLPKHTILPATAKVTSTTHNTLTQIDTSNYIDDVAIPGRDSKDRENRQTSGIRVISVRTVARTDTNNFL